MGRSSTESSVQMGIITARSVDVPSPPGDIFYSVQIEDDTGVVTYDGVVPQEVSRWSNVTDDELDLIPFIIGQRVIVGISRLGGEELIDIMTEEKPHMGECSVGGGP